MRIRISLWPLGLAACASLAWAQVLPERPATRPDAYLSERAFGARTLEPADRLTLAEAMRLALSANAELAASTREIAAQEGAVVQAGVWRNPELSSVVEDRQRPTRTTTYQLNQPLEIGGKRGARVEVAERGRDIAFVDHDAKAADIRAGVITAFFDVLAAQERVKIAQSLVDLAQRSTQAAARRVVAGRISPVEETKARVAEAAVKVDLAQAGSELISARQRLSAYWGNPAPRFTTAEGDAERLPALPPPGLLDERFAGAPDMRRARLELERRQAGVALEKAKRIPDITLSVGSKRDDTKDYSQSIVGVTIPLPLFDRNQGNLREALERRDKALDEMATVQLRLSSALAQTYEQLRTSRLEAESLRAEILPGAQSAFDAASMGFTLGKFSFLEVLDAQRTLFQAKTQYLRALAAAHRAGADLDRLLGKTDGIPR